MSDIMKQSEATYPCKIVRASGFSQKVHKTKDGIHSECGINLHRRLVDVRKTWRGVTCRNCLRWRHRL